MLCGISVGLVAVVCLWVVICGFVLWLLCMGIVVWYVFFRLISCPHFWGVLLGWLLGVVVLLQGFVVV